MRLCFGTATIGALGVINAPKEEDAVSLDEDGDGEDLKGWKKLKRKLVKETDPKV